jgi:hypothetical protein
MGLGAGEDEGQKLRRTRLDGANPEQQHEMDQTRRRFECQNAKKDDPQPRSITLKKSRSLAKVWDGLTSGRTIEARFSSNYTSSPQARVTSDSMQRYKCTFHFRWCAS